MHHSLCIILKNQTENVVLQWLILLQVDRDTAVSSTSSNEQTSWFIKPFFLIIAICIHIFSYKISQMFCICSSPLLLFLY